jgi:hypothetical protein
MLATIKAVKVMYQIIRDLVWFIGDPGEKVEWIFFKRMAI